MAMPLVCNGNQSVIWMLRGLERPQNAGTHQGETNSNVMGATKGDLHGDRDSRQRPRSQTAGAHQWRMTRDIDADACQRGH